MNRSCIHSASLSPYLDGELAPDVCRTLEAHVGTCDACRALLTQLRALRTAIRALPQPAIDGDLAPALWDRLAQQELRTASHRRRWCRWPMVPLAFAASVTLVLGVLLGTALIRTPAAEPAPGAALALFNPVPPGGICPGTRVCAPQARL